LPACTLARVCCLGALHVFIHQKNKKNTKGGGVFPKVKIITDICTMEFYPDNIGFNKTHNVLGCVFKFEEFSIVVCYTPQGIVDSIDVLNIEDGIEVLEY